MPDITSFKGQHRWLSNFYWCEVSLDGVVYPSTEHAYQAAKTLDREERNIVLHADTFREAKRLGYNLTIRKDWEQIKLSIMENLLRQKFSIGSSTALQLAATHDELVEGNNWHDTYWGVCDSKCRTPHLLPIGENHLGNLLMKIRSELHPTID